MSLDKDRQGFDNANHVWELFQALPFWVLTTVLNWPYSSFGFVCRINNVCGMATQRLLHRIQCSEVQTLGTYDFAHSLHERIIARLLSGENRETRIVGARVCHETSSWWCSCLRATFIVETHSCFRRLLLHMSEATVVHHNGKPVCRHVDNMLVSASHFFREINCSCTLDTACPRFFHHFIVNEKQDTYVRTAASTLLQTWWLSLGTPGPAALWEIRTTPPPKGIVRKLLSIAQQSGRTADQQSPLAFCRSPCSMLQGCQTSFQASKSSFIVESTTGHGWRGRTAALAGRFSVSNTTNTAWSGLSEWHVPAKFAFANSAVPEILLPLEKIAVPSSGSLASSSHHSRQCLVPSRDSAAFTADALAAVWWHFWRNDFVSRSVGSICAHSKSDWLREASAEIFAISSFAMNTSTLSSNAFSAIRSQNSDIFWLLDGKFSIELAQAIKR